MHTIELDCPPMSARPDTYIGQVVKDTILESLVVEPVSKCFGNWTWQFDVSDEDWNKIQPILKDRISKLYHAGYIRYGSW